MNPEKYEFQSEFARRYFSLGKAAGEAEGKTEGKAEGKAELLLKQAVLKFGPLSADAEQRIKASSAAELDQMGMRLLDAKTLDEVLGFG